MFYQSQQILIDATEVEDCTMYYIKANRSLISVNNNGVMDMFPAISRFYTT